MSHAGCGISPSRQTGDHATAVIASESEATQYSETSLIKPKSAAYWIPASAGMTDKGTAAEEMCYSGRLLTLFTQARTSASTSGSTALTSCTVMPALMRGSYSTLRMY